MNIWQERINDLERMDGQIGFNKIESKLQQFGPNFDLVLDEETSLCGHQVVD